jgi:uncharacterized protein (DUF2147 family)
VPFKKEISMKSLAFVVASLFAVTAFAQAPAAKKEEAKPAASAPAPAKAEVKKDATKSEPAKKDAKAATPAAK